MKKLILIAVAIFIISGCGPTTTGPSGPIKSGDPLGIDAGDDIGQDEVDQMSSSNNDLDEIPWCDWHDCPNDFEPPAPSKSGSIEMSRCPQGCEIYIQGCDIKGNISFDTKERIYHVKGQTFYEQTKIDPDYGERWFCTEQEAKANGWRKSLQ